MAKKRTRAVSLSLDWDSMVKDGEITEKGTKAHLAGIISYDREAVLFHTGSIYTGKWNALGMATYGSYVYPQGCMYEGGFQDGMFDGEGTLTYPMGQKLEAIWKKGKMIAYKFANVDSLEYSENWSYCVMPDRRFYVSIREGLQPAGREFKTNQQPERPLESGLFDVGCGYYNPLTRSIINARDPADYVNLEEKVALPVFENLKTEQPEEESLEDKFWIHDLTMVTDERHEWITKNCRKGWDEPAGYHPELYEDWISGRATELEALDQKYGEQNLIKGNSEIETNKYSADKISSDEKEKNLKL